MEQIKLPIKTKIAAWLMIIMGGLYLYSFLASTISFFFSRSPEPILIPLSPYEFFLRALQSFYPGVFGFFIPGLLLLFLKKRWIWFFVIVTFVIVSISEFMFSNSFGFFVFSLLPFFLLYFDRKNFFKIAP